MLFKCVLSILLLSVLNSPKYAVCANDPGGWENIFAYNRSSVLPLRHYGDKTYYLGYYIKATYLQAIQFCNNIHMNLLSIRNDDENNKLYKFIRDSNYLGGYWTSGSRLLDGQNWIWLSYGESIDYTKWAAGQPDDINEKCLQVSPQNGDLYWHDVKCDVQNYFICERYEPNTFNQVLDTQNSRWDNLMTRSSLTANIGLLQFENKKYFFGTLVKGSYMQAMQFCNIINMQLVSITSKEENDRLSKYIRDTRAGNTWWSSGSKMLDGKNWVWLTKGRSIEYTNWLPGQPDSEEQLCLQLVHGTNGGLMWADDYCSSLNNVLCESYDDEDYGIDIRFGGFGGFGGRPSVGVGTKSTAFSTTTKKPRVLPTGPVLNDEQWDSFLQETSPGAIAFRYHGGKKYHVEIDTLATQNQATRFCEYHGMQLVEINDEKETEDLEWLLLDTGVSGPYWLAATKVRGVWTWPTSQEVAQYTNWANGKPTASAKNCILVDDMATWSDEECDKTAYFICEAQMFPKPVLKPSVSNGQCEQPVVNVYINTNLVTEDGKDSLSKNILSSKDATLSDSGYQVQVNNNIGVAKGSSNSQSSYGSYGGLRK